MGGFGSLFWLYVFFFFSCRETLPAKLEVLSHPISLSRSGNWPSAYVSCCAAKRRGSPFNLFFPILHRVEWPNLPQTLSLTLPFLLPKLLVAKKLSSRYCITDPSLFNSFPLSASWPNLASPISPLASLCWKLAFQDD